MAVTYLDESIVTDVRQSKAPLNYSRSGYGSKIGTSWELRIGKRWYRVYVIQYSNAGSAYIVMRGKRLFLDFEPSDFHEPWYAESLAHKKRLRAKLGV